MDAWPMAKGPHDHGPHHGMAATGGLSRGEGMKYGSTYDVWCFQVLRPASVTDGFALLI